jgi:serine/threonine protein kinase
LPRSKYKFGRTLGAGTYGIVREAESPHGKCAVKIILKKNVKGNDQMVYDELQMLQRLQHPHIVKFFDWFESRVAYTRTHTRQQSTLTTNNRTNTTLLHNSPLEESCLTASAKRAASPKRTPLPP